MDSETQEPNALPGQAVTEAVGAPQIFVEGCTSIGMDNGIFKFQMTTLVHSQAGTMPEQRIVARLVMPFGAVLGLHEITGQIIENMKAQGWKPPAPAPKH